MQRVERITIPLPEGFDPNRHLAALSKLVSDSHGDGWEIVSVDTTAHLAYATRAVSVIEVDSAGRDGGVDEATTREVRLARGTKPSDGDRVAAKLEDTHPGWTLTSFDPYLSRAVLSRMSEREVRTRAAVAVALGVKPWDVHVTERSDGGFDLRFPSGYVPSRHDDKLTEVATAIVGTDGWYVTTDPAKLVGSIIPGEPATFPPTVDYPFDQKPAPFDPADGAWAKIPIGVTLGRTGGETGPTLTTDFVASPHAQISGLTGGGKGVLLTALISGAVARGWQFMLVDAVKGGVDYVDLQPYVRTGGWGEDLRSACAVLEMAYAEGVRRKAAIKTARVQKWTQLPPSAGIRPLLVVVDELTSLIAPEPVPKGIPKDSPIILEIGERNLLKATILSTMGKIAREQRFTGLSLVVATQVASSTTGVPTELRANLGAKILLGSKPTDNNRRLALSSPDAVPEVPTNIADDPSGAGRGVGVFEFEGVGVGVLKGFFAPPAAYAAWLGELKAATTDRPEPSPAEIARYTPSLDDGAGQAGPSTVGYQPRPSPELVAADDWDHDPATGRRLSGFERANAARHTATETARQAGP